MHPASSIILSIFPVVVGWAVKPNVFWDVGLHSPTYAAHLLYLTFKEKITTRKANKKAVKSTGHIFFLLFTDRSINCFWAAGNHQV